jgi:hypothetical protein
MVPYGIRHVLHSQYEWGSLGFGGRSFPTNTERSEKVVGKKGLSSSAGENRVAFGDLALQGRYGNDPQAHVGCVRGVGAA